MSSKSLPHVASFVSMNPNKRGPVELGILHVGREWISRGGTFSVHYIKDAPAWYAELLREAGIECGTVRLASWSNDVLRTCDDINPQVVHVHMHRHSMATELRKRGIHILRTEHSGRFPRRFEYTRKLVRWHQQRSLDIILCVSEYIARQTQRDFLVPPARTRVVYNGCDLTRFRPRPDDKSVLRQRLWGYTDEDRVVTVAAHLSPQKRQRLLVGAMPEVLRHVPRARLVIAGGGSCLTQLRSQVKKLGLEEAVIFCTGDNDVAELYAASDVAALTSMTEGLPSGMVEAQACGLPVVGTEAGGLPETFVDGETGILVDGTENAIAVALIDLLSDDARRLEMGMKALSRARSLFDPSVNARQVCDVYEELLSRP